MPVHKSQVTLCWGPINIVLFYFLKTMDNSLTIFKIIRVGYIFSFLVLIV